jgi:hypothetical protein
MPPKTCSQNRNSHPGVVDVPALHHKKDKVTKENRLVKDKDAKVDKIQKKKEHNLAMFEDSHHNISIFGIPFI